MAIRVSTTEYRERMRHWHEMAQRGEDILVTDRGRVVVRVGVDRADTKLDRLEREGLLRRATGRPPSADLPRVPAGGDSTPDISAARDR